MAHQWSHLMLDKTEVSEMAIKQIRLTKLFYFYDKQTFSSDTLMFPGAAPSQHYNR